MTALAAVPSEGEAIRPASEWPFYFDLLSPDQLVVNVEYQRPLSNFWKEVKENFNPAQVGVLIVAPTGRKAAGIYEVIDGQTRKEAMLARAREGLPTPDKVPVLVYPNLSPAERAKLFADMQTKRRGMRTYDRFRAQLVAKVPEAVAVAKVARDLGFSLSVDEDAHTLKAIATLEKLYRKGPEHLEQVLTIIRDTWGTEDKEATSAQMLAGISWVLLNQERLDTDRLVERLKEVSPSLLKHRASALREGKLPGSGSGMYMGQAILNLYMSRRG